MKNFFYESIDGNLDKLSSERNLRILPTISHDGKWIIRDGGKMLNLSSNDYLGIASDKEKSAMFCKEKSYGSFVFGSGSSRLLTGNYRIYDEAEDFLAERYRAEAALIFSSGYHMNSGLLPAICSAGRTLILADRLVHASIIDGMRLSRADFMRYRHRDYSHIVALLKKHYRQYEQVLLVTESIFSMDGDIADIDKLKMEMTGEQLRGILSRSGKLEQIYRTRRSGAANNAKDWLRAWLNLDNEVEINETLRKSREEQKRQYEEARRNNVDVNNDEPEQVRIYSDADRVNFVTEIEDLYTEFRDDDSEVFYEESMNRLKKWFGEDSFMAYRYEKYYENNQDADIYDMREYLKSLLEDPDNYPDA